MEQKKVKKNLMIRLLFLGVGFLLFLLLFGTRSTIDYGDPGTIIKLVTLGVYLVAGEKLIWFMFNSQKEKE